jgi:dsDNA-specific endonuclease/ATPase MutS2
MLEEAITYDFMLAMGRFIHEYRCTVPVFVEDGVSFHDATNVFIEGASPVSYKVGTTPHDFATSDRISVLTGANSGGKTTMLETVLTMQLLAQMGMPVPAAQMYTTIFENIRYLAKVKSQNAGAFETTLTSLVPVATDSGKRLILIDELESITEPGSAARIIATLITILQRNEDAFAIIVTHLGEEIGELCSVRIDGIEARGLDDELNLLVDRQPAFGRMGKSTPELIVEKLYRSTSGDVQKVYGEMLEQLKKR